MNKHRNVGRTVLPSASAAGACLAHGQTARPSAPRHGVTMLDLFTGSNAWGYLSSIRNPLSTSGARMRDHITSARPLPREWRKQTGCPDERAACEWVARKPLALESVKRPLNSSEVGPSRLNHISPLPCSRCPLLYSSP